MSSSDSEDSTAGMASATNDMNLASAEAFPSLPAASKPVFGAAPAWGSKGPAASRAAPAPAPVSSGASEVFSLPPQSIDPRVRQQGVADAVKEVYRQVPGCEVKVSTQARTGVLTFVIKAKNKDDLARVRRLLVSSCGLRTAIRFTIPSSVRPHLIGAQGRTLKALVAKCLVEIQIPKQAAKPEGEAAIPVSFDEDEEETEITITGDAEGIEMARKEIEAVVLQRAAKSTVKVPVPVIFHPFVQQTVASIMADTGAKVHIPPPTHKTDEEIIVTGDRDSVRRAASMINQVYEEAKSQTTTMKVAIPKKQHRYLLGQKGSNLQEILERTGCAVEVPPADKQGTEGEEVIVRGPSDKLIEAVTLVLEKANAYQSESLDLTKLLPPARKASAPILARYVINRERAGIRKIESEHENLEIRLHGTFFDVTAKSRTTLQAATAALKAHLMPLVTGMEVDSIEIPRALHGHIVGKGGAGVARLRTRIDEALGTEGALVDLVLPRKDDEDSDDEAADEIVVVAKAIAGRPDLMAKIKAEIQKHIETIADLTTATVAVDHKYHGRIIGSGGSSLKKLLAPYEGAVSIKFPSANDTAAEITVRGPSDKAADCVRRIKEMVDEWKHQEIMCSFQEDVKLPKESARRILGQARSADENAGSAGGWIIRAVKEKVAAVGDKGHGVQITDRDINMTRFDITSSGEKGDVITITGHKRAVQLAKEIILERSQKLADTVVTSINIPSKFHSKLIGKGGKVVGKLMELYNVHVKFPSRTPANNGAAVEEGDEDEDKTIDEDKVTIRGFKADVEKAKAELLALAEYEEAHSHSLVFTVPAKLLPRIVGRKGQTVHLIKEDTDTRIDFDRSKVEEGEEGDLAGEVTVTVEGPKAGCEQAKKKIMEIVNEQLDIAEHHMAIPRRFHRVIIGHSGVAIRNLVAQWTEDFGLAADRIQVKFPKDEGDDVLIRAPSKVVEKVVGLLEAEVKKHEASMPALAEPVEGAERIEEEIQIPRTDVARVVGRKGETITGIAGNRGVDIQISQGKDDSDSPMVGVKISGYSQEAIDGAKTDILSKLRTVETMSIPSLVMPFIENDRGRLRGADAGGSVNFEGDQLVLRGDRASVDGVKAVVSKRLEELSKYTHSTSVVITSTVRPHVIGRQGATINRIRSESGCMVDIFPAEKVGQAKGQFAVVILGADEDGIRKAQAAVEKIVKDQLQSNTQGGAGGAGSGKDDGTVLKRINVPLRHHRRLIGPKGANIEEIRNRVGGPINLQFPRAGITSNEVEVRASASAIDKCVKVISDMIREWGDETAAAQIAIVSDAPAVAPAGAGPDREATRTPDSTKASSEAEPAPAGPPGWSGKSILKGARGMPPPAPSPVLIPEPSYLPPSGPAPKQGDDEWKVIGKKAKPSAVAAIDVVAGSGAVPGASGEGKSKKKKNKKTAAGAESTAPAASDSFTFAPASPVGNWADEVDVPSPVSAGANGVAATDPTPRSDDWQTVNTVQRFKQKKLEETGTGAAPAASAASGGARNAFGVLEEPAAPKTSSKKKK